MTTVADILNFLETIAPRSMKMDWDSVGLHCGRRSQEVRKVLVALDPFEHVAQEAAEIGAQLIVTHHPLIFRPLPVITDDAAITRGIRLLCARDISAICAHTNLDCAPGGVNDTLAAVLGLKDVEVLDPMGTDCQGRPYGLLRAGTLEPQSLNAFLKTVRKNLGCPGLRYVDGGKPVHRVAVGGGSCGGELCEAIANGCDTFVTADVKYNDFWEALEQGLTLIDAGHFWTENPVVAVLAEKIAAAFPEVQVEISKKHQDCMKFF